MYSRSFKRVCCVDFETYFDSDFSLRKQSTSEYIRDSRFAITALGIQMDDEPYARVYHGRDAARALNEANWDETAFLAHHCQFDALILTERFGIKPCFYADTLSMARARHGTAAANNLDVLGRLYGFRGKEHKQGLMDMKGVRDMHTLDSEKLKRFIDYTGEDVEMTLGIFLKMVEQFPPEELQLIDITVRMFAEPSFLLTSHVAEEVHAEQIEKKKRLLEAAGIVDPKELSSNGRFAAALARLGVDVCFKDGAKGPIPAVAMQDVWFKALRDHPDERVRTLVEARIAVKSTILETRSKKMVERAAVNELTPIYLRYCGAHTMRWSGGDSFNPQNLVRGSGPRRALRAPVGHKINIADSSQIEARMNAWRAGQEDILDVFRNYDTIVGYDGKEPLRAGPDVYKYVAAKSIYHVPIEDIDKHQRFVGKTCVLGLGYGMGHKKFNHTLKIGQFGPPVDMPLEQCKGIVDAWRASNARIVRHWRDVQNMVTQAFMCEQEYNDGLLIYEGYKGDGYIHMLNGLYIRYHDVGRDEEGNLNYATRKGRNKLYGGLLVENIVQCLARIVIGEQMLKVQEQVDTKIVTCTHDEIVTISQDAIAEKNQQKILDIMSTPPFWARTLPLSAAGGVYQEYVKE